MFKEKIKISFYDCDPAGILFYANLFKFAHKAYEALISSFDLPINYFENNEYVVPIIHAEGDYSIPMKPGVEINVSVEVTQIRKSSFELSYKFINNNSKVCAEVKTVHVFVDNKSFEKISIPVQVLKKIELEY